MNDLAHVRRAPSRMLVAVPLGLAALALAPTVIDASPISTTPVPNGTMVLPAKKACAFKVVDRQLPGSKKTERVYRDGRHVVSGPSKDRLTNPAAGVSITFNTSGRITFRERADGRTSFRFAGRNILFFYPGDQGPEGVAGSNGALYYIVGRVGETLAKDGTVTAFAYRGRVTELCSRLS